MKSNKKKYCAEKKHTEITYKHAQRRRSWQYWAKLVK